MGLRRFSSVVVAGTLLVASAALGIAAAPAASAGQALDYQVTFVARVCPTYSDIMANRARNNIQESLRDLGKDTAYASGQAVSPSVEEPNNPACHPLDDWQFAIGTGYTGKTPATDYLSTVTNPYAQTIRVKPSTPELDALGQDTGRDIADAVTVTLTDAQAQLAQQSNRLWAQGGTKADPLLNSVFGGAYGFGALRCAIDNLNGDNVEWIGFQAGSRHVFCYYYAVQPPPSAGTIVVRKSLAAGTNGPADFRYVGNISYTSTNDFTLSPKDDTTPSSATFIRAAGDAWDFEEQPAAGYTLASLTCAQTTPPVTGPASTWKTSGAKAVVHVGDGATVRCDYVNQDVPPTTGELRLNKVTFGGVGSFPFRITDPTDVVTNVTGTTTAQGQEALVAHTPLGATGTWAVRETLPAPTALGLWDVTSVRCNGADITPVSTPGGSGTTYVTASRAVTAGETVDCTFANTFTPGGSLQLAKRTSGGTGSFSFLVLRGDQFDDDATVSDLFTLYEATTVSPGHTVLADPASGKPALTSLPVAAGSSSTYYLGELSPPDTTTASWRTTRVTCTDTDNGDAVPFRSFSGQRVISVSLTSAHPHVRCLADNTLVPVGTLDLTKTIAGPQAGNQGAVTVSVTCPDGTRTALEVAAHATGTTTLSSPVVVRDTMSCMVSETATGENAAAQLTSTMIAVDGGAPVSATRHAVEVRTAASTTVAVTDIYGGLAPSGATRQTSTLALAGLLLVLLGAVTYVVGTRA